jgi:hypothetical protein
MDYCTHNAGCNSHGTRLYWAPYPGSQLSILPASQLAAGSGLPILWGPVKS